MSQWHVNSQANNTKRLAYISCPHLIDVLPKLCGEKLIILRPHWHFAKNCVVKNLLFCAHIDWCFAKIVRWKTCYFVPTLIDVLPKLWCEKLVILCPHWLMFCQSCDVKNLLFCAHVDWCFAKIVRWKTCYFVPTLIDGLPKLWGEKLVILCPHWLMFCQSCDVKNLLFRAHVDWCFAKIVRWNTCYFVPTLIDVLPKFCGEKLVILPSQNKQTRGEANLQFGSSQSKFLWQQSTDEWQTNLLAKIRKWLAYILDDIVDVKLCCLHLYNTRDCTKRGVKSTVYNTSGRIRRIIHCVLACSLARSLPAITVSRCACKKMCMGCLSAVVAAAGDLMMMMMMMDVVGVAHLFVWCC